MSRIAGEAIASLSDSKLLSGLEGSKLLDFFSRIGVSRPGLESVRAKHVTGEMLVEFCEEDIRDVFEEFKDRFLIRKLLRDPALYHEHLKDFAQSVEVVTVLSDDSDSEQQEPVRFQSPRVTSTGLHGEEQGQRGRVGSAENSVIQPIRHHSEPAPQQRGSVQGVAQKSSLGTARPAPELSAAAAQQADWKHFSCMGESLRIPTAALASGLDFGKLGKQFLSQTPTSVGSALAPGLRSQGQLAPTAYPAHGQVGTSPLSAPSSSLYAGSRSFAPLAVNPASVTLANRLPQAGAIGLMQAKSLTGDIAALLDTPVSTTARSTDTFPKTNVSDSHINSLPKPLLSSSSGGTYPMPLLSGASRGTQESPVDHQMEAAYNGYAMESLQFIQTSISRFTAEELLAKKALRGKPSDAHSASHTIIRQAAQLAGIWRKAPPVKSITLQQKEKFLQAVFFAAPQLSEHKALVWQRLIQALQNRRKYLLDRKLGKRRSTTGKVISPDGNASNVPGRHYLQYGHNADMKEAAGSLSDTNIDSWTDYDIVEIDSDNSGDEYVMNIKEEVAEETQEGSSPCDVKTV